MHRPRRSSITSPPSGLALPSSPPSSSSSALRRSPSGQLLSRMSSPTATVAVCTAPSPQPALASSGGARARRSMSPSASSGDAEGRGRRLSFSRSRSQPIPISPTSPRASSSPHPTAPPAPAAARKPALGAHPNRESTLVFALRNNDAALLRTSHSAYTAARPSQKDNISEGSEGSGSGSGESYDVPIVDTSRPALSSRIAAPAASAKAGGLVGGVRYQNGWRMSSLASYTGLPQPPTLAGLQLAEGYPAVKTTEEVRYSLSGLNLARRGSAPGSIAAGRAPSPAPGALSPVSPLTSSSAYGQGRRSNSPAGPRPSGLVAPAASSPYTGSAGTPGTASLLGSSSGGGSLRRPPSPAASGLGRSSSARAPSPARSSLLSSGGGSARAPSPGRAGSSGGGGPTVVKGFDAPRPPSPGLAGGGRHASSLARSRSASHTSYHAPPSLSHAGASTYPQSSPLSSAGGTTTRPRSRLANPGLDQRLEVRASRDFEALDEYYERRREGGRREEQERRERREAEERLRRGYDRLSVGSSGQAAGR
ncbi:hypothetical protein JCM10213_003745 [Rhodosporidiobolus nylandii]